MADADLLKAILVRQGEHVGVLRALISTHPNKALLQKALEGESLLMESKALNDTKIPDPLREQIKDGLAEWIKILSTK